MDPAFSALLGLAAGLADVSVDSAERLGTAMLSRAAGGGAHSTLNNDGSPLQVSIGLSQPGARPAIRLIADPAAAEIEGGNRFGIVADALSGLLLSHGPDLRPLCQGVLARMLPADDATRAGLPNGGAWLAADLSGQGMAIYATARWGAPEQRWARARDWLAAILPGDAIAAKILTPLSARTELVSAGIEGSHPDNARAKLYWRLRGNAALNELGTPLLRRPEIADFLGCMIEDRRFPASGIVGSVSFSVASGALSDVKLDVCCHCVLRTWGGWMDALDRYTTRHALHANPLADRSDTDCADVAFVGLGLDATMRPRLNVYLKKADRMAWKLPRGRSRDGVPLASPR